MTKKTQPENIQGPLAYFIRFPGLKTAMPVIGEPLSRERHDAVKSLEMIMDLEVHELTARDRKRFIAHYLMASQYL